MKYSKLIKELEYWKNITNEDDPEIVVNDEPCSFEIERVQPVRGIENNKAIGLLFNYV